VVYVCFILSHVSSATLLHGAAVPLQVLTGLTPADISPLLCFGFYEPVYSKLDDSDFPSDSREKRGCCCWVGIAEHTLAML
jgi:hypothetical protein